MIIWFLFHSSVRPSFDRLHRQRGSTHRRPPKGCTRKMPCGVSRSCTIRSRPDRPCHERIISCLTYSSAGRMPALFQADAVFVSRPELPPHQRIVLNRLYSLLGYSQSEIKVTIAKSAVVQFCTRSLAHQQLIASHRSAQTLFQRRRERKIERERKSNSMYSKSSPYVAYRLPTAPRCFHAWKGRRSEKGWVLVAVANFPMFGTVEHLLL